MLLFSLYFVVRNVRQVGYEAPAEAASPAVSAPASNTRGGVGPNAAPVSSAPTSAGYGGGVGAPTGGGNTFPNRLMNIQKGYTGRAGGAAPQNAPGRGEVRHIVIFIKNIQLRCAPARMALRGLQESLAKKESLVPMVHQAGMVGFFFFSLIHYSSKSSSNKIFSRATRTRCKTGTSAKSRRFLFHLRTITTWAGWKSLCTNF